MISSEIEELMRCANRIVALYKGRKVGEFETKKVKTTDIITSIVGLRDN